MQRLCWSVKLVTNEIDAACELIDFLNFNAHFAEKIYTEQPQSAQGMEPLKLAA